MSSGGIEVLHRIIRRKMIRDSKPVQFRIYFSNRKQYLKVFIWKSRREMYAGADLDESNYWACFIPFILRKKLRCFGELHFTEEYLNDGVVAHELLHSVFDLAYKQDRIIRPPAPTASYTTKNNVYCEFLCGEIETLTNQFWRRRDSNLPVL